MQIYIDKDIENNKYKKIVYEKNKQGNIVLTHKTTGEHTKKLFYHT